MVDDDTLELRVHGVNNTPPTSLLYVVQEEYGDSLAGVYGKRSTTGLVRALSWGGLARLSPIPRIPLAGWVQSVGSAAWIFVVPFGLANVAYWSRHLTMPGKQFSGARVTAALSRIFSLGLTLLLASSICSVSLDMAEGRVHGKEPPLPSWLRWLGDRQPGYRLALLSAVGHPLRLRSGFRATGVPPTHPADLRAPRPQRRPPFSVGPFGTRTHTGHGFQARPGRLAQNVCLRCVFADLQTSRRRIGKDCILFDVQAVARISVRFIVRHR